MTYKDIHTTTVNKKTMLWQIAPYNKTGIPTNSIFYKGRCGIGGTTMEINHERHSIIVIPNVAPLRGKCNMYKEILPVKGEEGVTKEAKIKRIEEKLQTADGLIKIMITTDSFDCLIEAAVNIKKLDWLYDHFFLLLDECHAYITDNFRKRITIPFRYFWNFKNKSLISATPFEFSDPLFSQMSKHEIIINEPLGLIELIEVDDIHGAIHFILTHPDKFPSNVHIFYNSIKQLAERIRLVINEIGELDCNLYFSKSDDNLKKIEGLEHLYKEETIDNEYKKFNFYTSKYAEAWDLNDLNATIVLITDVKAMHTKVGITNKGVQSLGRLRNPANRILHFTNHCNNENRKGLNYFKRLHEHYATDSISAYQIHAKKSKKSSLKPFKKMMEAAEQYGEISGDLYSVKKEYIKIDQQVNQDNCNEEYNNMNFIMKAWQDSNYEVRLRKVIPTSLPNLKYIKSDQQFKLAIDMIHNLELNKDNLLL